MINISPRLLILTYLIDIKLRCAVSNDSWSLGAILNLKLNLISLFLK